MERLLPFICNARSRVEHCQSVIPIAMHVFSDLSIPDLIEEHLPNFRETLFSVSNAVPMYAHFVDRANPCEGNTLCSSRVAGPKNGNTTGMPPLTCQHRIRMHFINSIGLSMMQTLTGLEPSMADLDD